MFAFGNSDFLQALGWAVINSLWQIAFLWVVFQVIVSLGVTRPSAKSRLASMLLSAGFGWFLYTLISHWLIDPAALKRSLFAMGSFETGSNTLNRDLQTVLPFASVAYLMLLFVPVIQFVRNYQFVRLIRKNGLSRPDVEWKIFVQRFRERMGIHKPVYVYISDFVSSPVTVGFFKPIILMPLAAITNLSPKQIEAILLHELSHIRRYDYFINMVVSVIRTLLYFNPFVKLFAKTIEREREKSCDEMVIQFEYDPHGYASALLTLERNNFRRHAMAVAASGQRNDLLQRIEKILGIEKKRKRDFRRLGGMLTGVMCIVALNALFFFSSPVVENHSLAFTAFSNPFYQLVSDGKESPAVDNPVIPGKPNGREVKIQLASTKPQHQAKKTRVIIDGAPEARYVLSAPVTVNGFTPVDLRMHLQQELKKSEVAEVKKAVEATRRVLEEGQWKQVEKNIGDVLTEAEKENVHTKYLSEVDKVNWQTLEERLRLAYKQINWNKVNAQLSTAIANIRLDSLTTVCNSTLEDLSRAQEWMNENQAESIPDTDLNLGEVKFQKERVEKQLKFIKAIKDKKIIHL